MERDRLFLPHVAMALILAAGMAVGGYFIGNTLYKARIANNVATVKGLAEREVKANVAAWTVSFSTTQDTLQEAYGTANADLEKVADYLAKAGFTTEEMTRNALSVSVENERNEYGNETGKKRYSVSGAIDVRSEDVDKIAAAAQAAGDLVGQGVLLTATPPRYMFTKLNDIKPEMLGEATRNARVAAQQFAKDANADVGNIFSAEQGAFNFSSRDATSEYDGAESASIYKKIRVVTTISFYLN